MRQFQIFFTDDNGTEHLFGWWGCVKNYREAKHLLKLAGFDKRQFKFKVEIGPFERWTDVVGNKPFYHPTRHLKPHEPNGNYTYMLGLKLHLN